MSHASVCIVGAGAIGGYLAVRLARAGHRVTVVARGAQLEAIRRNGLTLIAASGESETIAPTRATADLREAGPQDVVIVAVKAHQLAPLAAGLDAVFHAHTVLVPMQNGIPWWYFQRHGGPFEGRAVTSVDPDGTLARTIDPKRIVGCVVYPATALERPGVVRHVEGNRFPVGELDGNTTVRAQRVSELFIGAGLKSPVLPDIRSEIWLKLWGNLSFNPISAVTGATLAHICRYPHTRALAAGMMREAAAVANELGVTFRVPLEHRIAGAEKVGEHKTSMLQDIEAGRATEIDALLGSVIELARLTGTAVPQLEAVYACAKLRSLVALHAHRETGEKPNPPVAAAMTG